MKVTIFMGGLSGGGAERVTCELANYLVDKGHQMTVLTMSDDEPSYPLCKDVVRIPLLTQGERTNFLMNSGRRFIRLSRYVRKNQPDTYLVMLPVTIILLLLLKPHTKSPVIISERNAPQAYGRLTVWLLKHLASRASRCVCQTPEIASWYAGVMGTDKVVTIPNAIRSEQVSEPYEGERKKVIVTVGRLNRQKRHDLLIRSFARIHREFPEYALVIYGEGKLCGELTGLAEQEGVAESVKMPGYRQDIAERIKDAALFVLASDYEGMPNALIEAMALGVPCVATDCKGGGARMLIKDGQNGLLVSRDDEQALASAISRMLSDLKFASQCGQNASRISKQLAPSQIYEAWEQVMLSVVES